MSPVAIIILIIVLLVIIAAVPFACVRRGARSLQNTFGPEYDRVVADTGSRADAEKELREREKRHAELELKPLSAESKARYSAPGKKCRSSSSTTRARRSLRGRPRHRADRRTRLPDRRLRRPARQPLGRARADAGPLPRRARDQPAQHRGEASTEDLRQALVHYRALFADLLGTEPVRTDTTDTTDTGTARRRRPTPTASAPTSTATT